MASGGLLRYDEPTERFGVVNAVRSALADTEQLLSTCDMADVNKDRNRLLELCRDLAIEATG